MPQSRRPQGLKRHPSWALAAFGLVYLVGITEVSAQSVSPGDRQAVLSSASSTTTTSVVGGVIITVTVSSSSANLEQYLRHNAVAVYHDVTRGAGPTVDDLADAFGATDRRQFGALLRNRRSELFAAMRDLDTAAAQKFAAVIADDLRRDAL